MAQADDKLIIGKGHARNVPESQAVNESLKPTEASTDHELSNGFEKESIALPPLNILQGASPSSEAISLTFQPYFLKEIHGLVRISCYTQNRSIIVIRHDKTLYEIFKETSPDISYFHVFGCPVFIHNHKDHLGKFDAKADDGYFLGYSFVSKAIRVFNTRRQQEDDRSRQYQVDSDISYYVIPHGRSLIELSQQNHVPEVIALNEPNIPQSEDTKDHPDLINTNGTQEQNVQNEQMITQPTEEFTGNNTEISGPINEPLVLDVIQSHISNQALTSFNPTPQDRRIETKKVSEALKHPRWINTMQEELNQFYRNRLWTLVPLPYIKIALCSKWVFKNKKNEHGTTTKNKARLVTQSYSQEEGIDYDETFAPAPPGFKVCKLNKALYGLKQAPRACYVCKISIQSKGITSNSYEKNPQKKHLKFLLNTLWKTGVLECQETAVDMSSAKDEYVAAAGCCASFLWMKSQLSDYDIDYKMVPIFCDDTTTIAISNNPRSKLDSTCDHLVFDIFPLPFFASKMIEMAANQAIKYASQCGDLTVKSFVFQTNNVVGNFNYPQTALAYKPICKFLLNCPLKTAFTKCPLDLYQNFLREFWCTAIPYDPNPSDNEAKPHPLKEFLIKFSVMNGKKPLNLNFATFVTSTGLDYSKGKYVSHPFPEDVKAELAKINTNPSYLDKTPVQKNSFPMAWRILITFVIQDKIMKAKKQTRLLTITKPKVIKVIQEEAEKIRVVPKKISSAKTDEEFKKAQDAKHPVLKIKHSKKAKKIPKELGIQYALPSPISEQAPSQTSGRKKKHMEMEPEVNVPRLEYDMSHPEGVSFVNNMVIKEPENGIFFIDVFGDQAFQRWNDIHKVGVDSLVSYLVMASTNKTPEIARFFLKLRKMIADYPDKEKLKSKKVKLEALGYHLD
nr:hypothetical protein [Tanacetum cinerariifolium]